MNNHLLAGLLGLAGWFNMFLRRRAVRRGPGFWTRLAQCARRPALENQSCLVKPSFRTLIGPDEVRYSF
jgi:hypothetical protein